MGYLERRRGYSLRAATGLSAQSSTMALGETPANSFQRKRGVRHAFQGVEVRVVRLMVNGLTPPRLGACVGTPLLFDGLGELCFGLEGEAEADLGAVMRVRGFGLGGFGQPHIAAGH